MHKAMSKKEIKKKNSPLESPNTKIQKRNQRTHILQRKNTSNVQIKNSKNSNEQIQQIKK